jgi:hypothetical protein
MQAFHAGDIHVMYAEDRRDGQELAKLAGARVQ